MTRSISSAVAAVVSAAILAAGVTWSRPAAAVDPFIGTIRYFGFNFAPRNWAFCDGQLLAISQNDALFALIGTTYGGDGRTTFALPDMRGRMPLHRGTGPGLSTRTIGARGGAERVTLNANQIGHGHALRGSVSEGNQTSPAGHALAQDGNDNTYANVAPTAQMAAGSIGTAPGGGQSHENRSPSLGVFCNIALVGIFPSRN